MSEFIERLIGINHPVVEDFVLMGMALDACFDIREDTTATEELKDLRCDGIMRSVGHLKQIQNTYGYANVILVPAMKQRIALISKATSATEINSTFLPHKPRYNHNKVVNDNPYAVPAEELMGWMHAVAYAPVVHYANDRIHELWEITFGMPADEWFQQLEENLRDNKEE